jgi:16S rRNA (uracil1498-N3)-methyltransferase
LKQFILRNAPDSNNAVRLGGSDYRYLVSVRRLTTGECFPAILPGGSEILVQIQSINNGELTGKCFPAAQDPINMSTLCKNNSYLPPIILFQALPKGDKMDIIVRQAAESGITGIIPFASEYSISKTKADGQKFSRWERIIREARQQSGSRIATEIHKPLAFDELLKYWGILKTNGGIGIFFHHQGIEQKSLHSYLNNIPVSIALAVGPEGGFSEAEVSIFLENGLLPMTIGDTVLRTETAAIYCTAAVKIILLERDSWEMNKEKSDNV